MRSDLLRLERLTTSMNHERGRGRGAVCKLIRNHSQEPK